MKTFIARFLRDYKDKMSIELTASHRSIIEYLLDSMPEYLESLEDSTEPGRFYPCKEGLTEAGKKLELGFSCLALKNYYILGLWDQLDKTMKNRWLTRIKAFQRNRDSKNSLYSNAFIDPCLTGELSSLARQATKLKRALRHPRTWWRSRSNDGPLSETQRAVVAETKQAISTLIQVGERPHRIYSGLQDRYPDPARYIGMLDWSAPWRAGGQAAALVVFLRTMHEWRNKSGVVESTDLVSCTSAFANICDRETGAYFTGAPPAYTQLVNGAMKVISALEWLNEKIHRPERLIDTVLSRMPESGGCNLVDSVYVLERCLQQTDYKRNAAGAYCLDVLEMIAAHRNPDGGMSYNIGRSGEYYYGVKYATGRPVSDLHGTSLLSWAISKILLILQEDDFPLRDLKP